MRTTVAIGDRLVGDGQPVFVTFEAGPTHSGLDSAKRLATLAKNSGADAVKFQLTDPDRLIADRTVTFTYDVLLDRQTGATETVTESLYELVKRRYLTNDEWRQVKRHCDDIGIAFFATTSFPEGVDLLVELNCDSIKIGSVDVVNLPFIRQVARSGKCIQLDTGNGTIGEIEAAVDAIRAEGNENIIIHHCPSGYPARLEGVNLRVLSTLRQMFPYPVAFSDHSPGWEMDVAAVTLGANLLEKTITEDRTTRSVEHIMSLEPQDMVKFLEIVRGIEVALGNPRRIMYPAELAKRNNYRRSAYLLAPVAAGTKLADAPIEWRRPGFGITGDLFERVSGAVIRADLPANHCLSFKDLEW